MYLISSIWVNQWIKFVQKNDYLKESPPGPIKNEDLEEFLVFKDKKDSLKKNEDYYLLTREVWEFFFNIYGGGPTIVINSRDELNLTTPSEAGYNKLEI